MVGVAAGGVGADPRHRADAGGDAGRSFGAVIAYSKIEPVQVALFGIVILGDPLGLWTAAAILLS